MRVRALEEEMKSAGAWVFGGRLHQPDTATVVRVSDGKILTTDGPFAETKEHIGGFYIIEAKDFDAAIAWASKTADGVNTAIEVILGSEGKLTSSPGARSMRWPHRRKHCLPRLLASSAPWAPSAAFGPSAGALTAGPARFRRYSNMARFTRSAAAGVD